LRGSRAEMPSDTTGVRRGAHMWKSYLPTLLNIVQLVGWTAFEIFIMAEAAFSMTGLNRAFWALFFSILVHADGPLGTSSGSRYYIEIRGLGSPSGDAIARLPDNTAYSRAGCPCSKQWI